VGTEVNEIKCYLDARWIGPHEASWRIFEFRMHAESPPVEMLPVHEEGPQAVVFEPDQPGEAVLNAAARKPSKLMAFFKYYADHPQATKYLYSNMPQHFVWKTDCHPWKWVEWI
jgi:hypothetical protein